MFILIVNIFVLFYTWLDILSDCGGKVVEMLLTVRNLSYTDDIVIKNRNKTSKHIRNIP